VKDDRFLPGIEVAKPRRLVAALLGMLLLVQCLPLTIPAPADFRSGVKVEAKSFFEPLQVCEHGENPAAYFAAHPWIPGVMPFSCTSVSETGFPGVAKVGLSEGFPPAVYKPPRVTHC
jgi:hypothetical protein